MANVTLLICCLCGIHLESTLQSISDFALYSALLAGVLWGSIREGQTEADGVQHSPF